MEKLLASHPSASRTLLGSSLALALAAPGTFLPTGAQAQTTGKPATLSPVTVQGDRGDNYKADEASQAKFTAPLLDTPKSVQVIPQAIIQDTNATSLEDVLRNSPGITFGAGEGGQPLADPSSAAPPRPATSTWTESAMRAARRVKSSTWKAWKSSGARIPPWAGAARAAAASI
jgi:outer membrane receptor protein involved in Fe transport